MQPYQGSCHCGAIQFSFEAEPFAQGIRCNCSFCARRSTTAHLVPGAQFKIEAQEGALGCYQWGKMQAKHYFCKTCGISTFSETSRRPGQYIVNLGCMEGVDVFALPIVMFDGKNLL